MRSGRQFRPVGSHQHHSQPAKVNLDEACATFIANFATNKDVLVDLQSKFELAQLVEETPEIVTEVPFSAAPKSILRKAHQQRSAKSVNWHTDEHLRSEVKYFYELEKELDWYCRDYPNIPDLLVKNRWEFNNDGSRGYLEKRMGFLVRIKSSFVP